MSFLLEIIPKGGTPLILQHRRRPVHRHLYGREFHASSVSRTLLYTNLRTIEDQIPKGEHMYIHYIYIFIYTQTVYNTKGTRAHTHRELIRKWLWELKGSSLEYI